MQHTLLQVGQGANQWIPYLKDPLVLVGFFLFVAFLFLRSLVTNGVIPQLKKDDSFSLLKLILMYGFVIGLVLIGLGFGLKYREMSKAEQKRLVRLLGNEMEHNINQISELKKNTETFLQAQLNLAQMVRTPGIKILPYMFPDANLDLKREVNTKELARQGYEDMIQAGLVKNTAEMKKLEDFARVLIASLQQQRQTKENLRDSSRVRYKMKDDVWQANLEVYKKIDVIDVGLFQRAYSQQEKIRNDYDIVTGQCLQYSDKVTAYFDANNELTWEQLATVLAVERHSFDLLIEYSKNLYNTLVDLNKMYEDLRKDLKELEGE